ncbi:MAG: hypothetical protein ACYSU3_20610 [Planctomycetota bacterium]|jgi:hypothetical protein
MAYRRIRGIKGLVYEPEPNQQGSKHNCKDCFYCQWCSDIRCENCLKEKTCRKKKKVIRKKVTKKKAKKKPKKKVKKKSKKNVRN